MICIRRIPRSRAARAASRITQPMVTSNPPARRKPSVLPSMPMCRILAPRVVGGQHQHLQGGTEGMAASASSDLADPQDVVAQASRQDLALPIAVKQAAICNSWPASGSGQACQWPPTPALTRVMSVSGQAGKPQRDAGGTTQPDRRPATRRRRIRSTGQADASKTIGKAGDAG